jgi:hypothetical protein
VAQDVGPEFKPQHHKKKKKRKKSLKKTSIPSKPVTTLCIHQLNPFFLNMIGQPKVIRGLWSGSAVEHLLSKLEVLSSNPMAAKRKKKKKVISYMI